MDSQEQRIETLSRRVSDLQFGLKIIAGVFLLIASLGDIAITFSINYYENFFRDVLHGAPLPFFTEIAVRFKFFLFILSFWWPLMGLGALFVQKRARLTFILVGIALSATFLQSILIIAVMQLPSLSIISSIQDSSSPR